MNRRKFLLLVAVGVAAIAGGDNSPPEYQVMSQAEIDHATKLKQYVAWFGGNFDALGGLK